MIKVIYVNAKCSDMFSMESDTGEVMEGTVHYAFGGGDYIRLKVDNATGRIIDWQPLDEADFGNEE